MCLSESNSPCLFFLQGMMGNNMPMSPDALSPGGKPAYYRGMCYTLFS